MKKIKIIGLNGSLRQCSYNKASLMEASKMLSETIEFEILDLSEIPFFNEDLETVGIPETVINLNNKLKEADAILIATPEYNHSIPAVLKNAIDWASRSKDNPLNNKPTAIMSASLSLFGGIRAQNHLRQVCTSLNMQVLNKPEVAIMTANNKFDENLNLTDEFSKSSIEKLLLSLIKKVENK